MLEGGPGLQAGQGRPGGPKEKAGRIEGEGREDRRRRHGVSGRPGGQPSPEVSEPRASPHEGSSEESSSCPGLVRGLMFCEVLLLFFPTLLLSRGELGSFISFGRGQSNNFCCFPRSVHRDKVCAKVHHTHRHCIPDC